MTGATPKVDVIGRFRLLGDPTRVQILESLAEHGPMHVTEIHVAIGSCYASIANHLALLRAGGMVTAKRIQKHVYYELTELGTVAVRVAEQLGKVER